MEIQRLGIEQMQEQTLEQLKNLTKIVESLQGNDKDRIIPKTRMQDEFDISGSSCVNYEKEGIFKPLKLGARVYYRYSDILNALVEKQVKK